MRARTAWVGIGIAAALAVGGTLAALPTRPGSPTARPVSASAAALAPRLSAAATPPTAAPAACVTGGHDAGPTDTGCVIVRLKPGVTARQLASLGASGARKLGRTGLVTLAAPKGTTAAAYAARLSHSGAVEYAEPDYLLKTATNYTATPNDPDFSDPYAYTVYNITYGYPPIAHVRSWPLRDANSANFDEVWPALASANATAGQVHVAVMDTGFYFEHPDATGSNIRSAVDECATYDPLTSQLTTDTDCEPVPASSGADPLEIAHGTMTAGEIGAGADNGIGGVGAAYDTQVDIYKVMGIAKRAGTVDGSTVSAGEAVIPVSALVSAMYDATNASVANHYRLVINISLELRIDSASTQVHALSSAVSYAKAHDVVVVAASGNGDDSHQAYPTVSYPAAIPGVIAVGAYTVSTGRPAFAAYSNYGSALALLAPGSDVWGPTDPTTVTYSPYEATPRTGYDWWDGTSMAAPYAASAAALLLRVQPNLTNTEVASCLASGAVDMGTPGWDSRTGWGRLDAYRSFYLLATPRTTANVRPLYADSASISFVVTSRRTGTTFTTHYTLDDTTTVLTGGRAETSTLGPHALTYWSVDSNGVVEQAHTATFTITPRDTTPPSTTAKTSASYTGFARIGLVATDTGTPAWGVDKTRYSLDGQTAQTGSSVVTGRYGPRVLRFWSVDLAGNVEAAHTARFSIRKATPTLTLSRSASTMRRNATVRLSGFLTPARTGDYVRLQVRYPGSSHWYNLTSSSLRKVTASTFGSRGSFATLTTKLTRHGRYYFRAYFAGDTVSISRYSRYSGTVSVYVN